MSYEDPALFYIVWYFICGIFNLIFVLTFIMMATPQELTTFPGYTTLGPLVLLILAPLIVLAWPLNYIFVGLFGFVISSIIPGGNSIMPLLCLGIILTPLISKPITDYLLSKRRTSQISI